MSDFIYWDIDSGLCTRLAENQQQQEMERSVFLCILFYWYGVLENVYGSQKRDVTLKQLTVWQPKCRENLLPYGKRKTHSLNKMQSSFLSTQWALTMSCIRWKMHYTFVMDLDGSNNHLETLFPESHVFFETRQKRQRKHRGGRTKGKNNFLFEEQSDFVLVNLRCTPRWKRAAVALKSSSQN